MLGIHYGSSETHRPVNNKGFECRPRLCKASMECEHAWKSLEFLKGPTDQSTIRDSDAARASARLLWRVEMFGIHWNSLGGHRSANNKGFGCRPRRCKASMVGGNAFNPFAPGFVPTDQSTMRDSNAARASTGPPWG